MADDLTAPGQQPDAAANSQPLPATTSSQPTTQQQKQTVPYRRVAVNQMGQNQPLRKGSIFVGRYLFWKHDPYPLVLVSSLYTDGRVAGVNLHYLTFNYVRKLVQNYCNKSFGYPLIKGDKYIVNAFRTYKKQGLRQVRVIDCDFLLNVLGSVRSYKPSEIEKIRQQVQQQLRQQVNPRADDIAKYFSQRTLQQKQGAKDTKADGRRVPQGLQPAKSSASIPGQPTKPASVPAQTISPQQGS